MTRATARIDEIGRSLRHEHASLGSAARGILEAVGAARVSIAAIAPKSRSFEIVEAQGEPLLGRGTRFPVETSTHHERAAAGATFVAEDFACHRGFSRPLDRIVQAHGFRSGASLPLHDENGTQGALNLHWNRPGASAARAVRLVEPLLERLARTLARSLPSAPTTVLVCHDDALVGRGIARLLEETGAAIADVAPAREAALAARRMTGLDVLVGDESLGGERVDRWIARLREAGVQAPLLVVPALGSRESLAAALAAGAAGYVPRADAESCLRSAVDAVARGQTWLPLPRGGPAAATLTPRELDVLQGLDRGLRFRQLADALGVSVTTVKTHARSLFRKLGASSRAEATYEARRRGLIT